MNAPSRDIPSVDRAHAKALQQQFLNAEVPAEYIDCYTDAIERNAIAKRFHAGEVQVVCNVGCLTTGIDWDVRYLLLDPPSRRFCSSRWSAAACAPPTARTNA